jgi:hypothetical protein
MTIYDVLDTVGSIDSGAKAVCLTQLAQSNQLREEVVNLSNADDISGVSDKLHLEELLRQDDLRIVHLKHTKRKKQ